MPRSKEVQKLPQRRSPRMHIKEQAPGVVSLDIDGDFSRLGDATGNTDVTLGLLSQLAELRSTANLADSSAANFALGFIDGMKARDGAEALQLAQMAIIHQATMMLASRLNQSRTLLEQDSASQALTKLARTYAVQMEALKRYRSDVHQKVQVESVTVESGGQAIVGNVVTGRPHHEK